MSSPNEEVIARRIKTPANRHTPLEIFTYGQLRGFFRAEEPAFEGLEVSADPAAPPLGSNRGVWFFRDNGAGKTQFCVRYPSGATQILATEP